MTREQKKKAKAVYNLYRKTPWDGESSYLHDHWQRGVLGVMEPDKKAYLAHAAWRAGRAGRSEFHP